jgi:hypothetical protein
MEVDEVKWTLLFLMPALTMADKSGQIKNLPWNGGLIISAVSVANKYPC